MLALLADRTLREGETIQKHHCKTGRDNDRLYITNRAGTYLFYCHHCSNSGSLTPPGATTYQTVKDKYKTYSSSATTPESTTRFSTKVYFPRDAVKWTDKTKWSPEAKRYIRRYLSGQEIQDNGICFSRERLVFPVIHASKLVGLLKRRVLATSTAPKWVWEYSDKSCNFVFSKLHTNRTVVLVEDMVSKIVVSRHTNAMAVLGTVISDKAVNTLVRAGINTFVVWLDDDNPQVKRKQIAMQKKLELVGTVRIIHVGTDPKNLSEQEICENL